MQLAIPKFCGENYWNTVLLLCSSITEIQYYYEDSLHIKAHFAGDNRKSQGWDIICRLLSVSISCYLQMQCAEISLPAGHQGINYIFALKSVTVSLFPDYQKHEDITMRWGDEDITMPSFSLYTWRNGLISFTWRNGLIVWY